MLTPCSPCSCPGAPCEQCMFGYQSDETKHNIMKNLIEKTFKGEKPIVSSAAKRYMEKHKNWLDEMEEGCKEEINKDIKGGNKGMLQTGILMKCERCGEEEFFPDMNCRGDADVAVEASNWKTIENKHVCPICAGDYKTRMESFWNEFWDK